MNATRKIGWIVIVSAALGFALPLCADEPDPLQEAADLVSQVSSPVEYPHTDAERIEMLTRALKLVQQMPNHRLKGHRVAAVQAMRSALIELQKGDPDHKAAADLDTADDELGTAAALAKTPEPSAKPAPIPAPPSPPPATPAAATPPTTTLSAADLTSITEVITRLIANASAKPPGPVEDDVTEQSASGIADVDKGFSTQLHKSMPSTRDSIAGEYNKCILEGPLTSLFATSSTAIVAAKVKMTPDALADWKSDPPNGSMSSTVDGKEVTQYGVGPGFSDLGGSQLLEIKVRDSGEVIATYCLVQQQGQWKVHCVAFSNDPLKKEDLKFFIEQLTAMVNKPPLAIVPAGYAILHNFGDGTVLNDGHDPRGSLYQPMNDNSFLYGITKDKDNSNSGTIFKINLQGQEIILHTFDGPMPADGTPSDAASDFPVGFGAYGEIWGVTEGGGKNNCGTAFTISKDGDFKIVHEFGDSGIKDGPRGPQPQFLSPDGNMYGISNFGGTKGSGTVYKMTAEGAVTTLHNFGDGSVPNDGTSPVGPLLLGPDDCYYGATFNGSGSDDKPDFKGTLFKMTPIGKVKIIHRFADGSVPNDGKVTVKGGVGLFMTLDDTLYGTTELGGTSAGTFFKVTPDGAITILHVFGDFATKDGVWPNPTLVIGPDGNFYGTTGAGGTANKGTIYKITPDGTVTILHNFGDGSVPSDGIKPGGGLVLANDGNFYGTTREGGSAGKGTVFRLKVP